MYESRECACIIVGADSAGCARAHECAKSGRTRVHLIESAGVISVTMIHAGETTNVVPDFCEIRGTVRAFTLDVLDRRGASAHIPQINKNPVPSALSDRTG